MDLEIRTGLLESRKLNTLIEITIPRDILLLGLVMGVGGHGQWWLFPNLPTPLTPPSPTHQSLGTWVRAVHSLQLSLITSEGGL